MMLSVVIVNYNGKSFLDDCLKSIRWHSSESTTEVIVVDNASIDGSGEWIEEHHPWVKLISSQENLGFTGGNNLGAAEARGKYILLLNSDTVVTGSLEPMIEIMEESPRVGVLGCQLRYGNNELQESIGCEHTPLSLPLSWTGLSSIFPSCKRFRRVLCADDPAYGSHLIEAPWVSGACLMTPLKIWNDLAGLDERYFMYVEDVDYCKRVRMAGYTVNYTADLMVTHYEAGGRSWVGERALLDTVSSYKIYTRKHFGPLGEVVMRTTLAPIFIVRSFSFFVLSLFRSDKSYIEKARAYSLAAKRLIF